MRWLEWGSRGTSPRPQRNPKARRTQKEEIQTARSLVALFVLPCAAHFSSPLFPLQLCLCLVPFFSLLLSLLPPSFTPHPAHPVLLLSSLPPGSLKNTSRNRSGTHSVAALNSTQRIPAPPCSSRCPRLSSNLCSPRYQALQDLIPVAWLKVNVHGFSIYPG